MEQTYELPPIRTINKAIEELQAADKDNQLTKTALRTLIITGEIPAVKIGTKYLINMNVLAEYLRKGNNNPDNEVKDYGKIRMVKE